MQLLHCGAVGPAVAEIKNTLTALGLLPGSNGSHGPAKYDAAVEHAVRVFQQQRGLITDGVVGPATYRALTDARWQLGDRSLAFMVSRPVSGDDVFALQERLLELGYDVGRPDGVFGHETEQGLRSFQREYGLNPDGICGPHTLRALKQLAPKVRGSGASAS